MAKKNFVIFIIAIMAVSLMPSTLGMTTGFTAYADDKSDGTIDPYVYEIDKPHIYQYRSPHRDDSGIATAMYRLKNITDSANDNIVLGYCCDLNTTINTNDNIMYRRLNLEDSSYYDEEKARHIRAVLRNGYWYGYGGPTQETSEKLKALAEAAKISDNEVLTAAEALAATQHAIWHYANSNPQEEGDKVKRYSKSIAANLGSNNNAIKDAETVDADENAGESIETEKGKIIGEHIEKVYNYLINLAPAMPSSVIWDFEDQGVLISAEATENGNISYDAIAKFKMSGSTDETAGLTVTATPDVKGETKPITPKKIALKDLDFEKGYYTITFENLTEDQINGITNIRFELDGIQKIEDDVYFYEPEGGRNVSQCFVGFASGETPIHREWKMEVSLEKKELNLFKYENNSQQPIPGAKFQLYAKIDFDNGTEFTHPVGDEMKTDEKGNITWTALASADNISYYCVETEPPLGYKQDNAKYYFDQGDSVYVSNCRDTGDVLINKTVINDSSCEQHFRFKVEIDFSKAILRDRLSDVEKTVSSDEIKWLKKCSDDSELHPDIHWSGDGDVKTAYVMLENGESLTIKNLPVGTICSVTELEENGSVDNSNDHILVYNGTPYAPYDITISNKIKSNVNKINFTNTKYEEASIVLNGKKYLDGKASAVPFEFCIAQLNNDGSRGAILQKTANDKDGNFAFEPIRYTKPGIYRYQVWESSNMGGYNLDASVYNIEVVVEKGVNDNKLIANKTITIANTMKNSEYLSDNENLQEVIPVMEFRNTTRYVADYDKVSVTKRWVLDNDSATQPVKVQLLKDGTVFDTITLTEETNWTYHWNYLSKGPKWTVKEITPDGFTSSVTKNGNNYTITNTTTIYTDDDDDEIIEDEYKDNNKDKDRDDPGNKPEITKTVDRIDQDAPKTSDNTNLIIWMVILASAAVTLVSILIAAKNKNRDRC